MSKMVVTAPKAGTPAGPYSQAIIANGIIFVSAEKGVDPRTNEVAPGGIQAETEQALRNIAAVLEAAGSSLEHVVRCVVYLQDIRQFAEMNQAYARAFTDSPPARTTIGVAGLPLGLHVMIEATAVIPV